MANYYKRHVGDYVKDTIGLSMLEDGAYNRLLDQYYASGHQLPPDRKEIYRLARANNGGERRAVDYVLAHFFEERPTGWHQRRADAELLSTHDRSLSAIESGRQGGLQRAENIKNSSSDRLANARKQRSESQPTRAPVHKPLASTASNEAVRKNPSDSFVGQEPDTVPKINGNHHRKELIAVAVRLIAFLNEKTGARYEPVKANVDLVVARLNEGFTEKAIRQVIANRCLAWQGDPKMDEYLRPKTLFGARNFASYAGQIGKTPVEPIPQEKA